MPGAVAPFALPLCTPLAASERYYTAASGELQVPWCGIHEWRKVEQAD